MCCVLNRHPLIQLTNECRSFVLLKGLIERSAVQPDLIGLEFQQNFTAFVHRHAGELIERFYREALGVTTPIWGDKHPPYADPTVLSGRDGSQPRLPQSGSCLRLIRNSLRSAKFIHIQRDPVQVARSLVRKRWTPSFADGINVWRQYVDEIAEFFAEIEPHQQLTIMYRELLTEPEAVAESIGRFLNLPGWAEIEHFLLEQHRRPTPFSDPSTDLSIAYRESGVR